VDSDAGRPVVAGAGLTGLLDAVAVVAGAFDSARVGAVPPDGVDLPGDVGQDVR